MSLELRRREGGELRCPYCHDALVADEQPTRCGACRAVHHATCARELGRCASCSAEIRVRVQLSPGRRCFCGSQAVLGDALCDMHRRQSISATHGEAVRSLERASQLDVVSQAIRMFGCLTAVPLFPLAFALVVFRAPVLAVLALTGPFLVFGIAYGVTRRARWLREAAYAIPESVLRGED